MKINMNDEQKLLWIIPNGQYMDKGLLDGKAQLFPKTSINGDHVKNVENFVKVLA